MNLQPVEAIACGLWEFSWSVNERHQRPDIFSASDLMRFMGCRHATALDLAYMQGEGPEPREDSEDADLLQKQGDAHEAAHLAGLKAAGQVGGRNTA